MVRLGELILERGLVDKPALVKALEEASRVPYLDCSTVPCELPALQSVPKSIAVRLDVLPFCMEQGRLVVVMAEPQNIATINELRFTTGKDISPRLGFRAGILSAIVRNYDLVEASSPARQDSAAEDAALAGDAEMEFISTSSRQANREAIQEIQAELNQKETPAVRLVSEIIHTALDKRASDIHIEPQAAATVVRVRMDGVLRELESVPRAVQNSLVSRIRILSDMDIGERRAPQDGRFMVAVGQRKVDMRVSTLPTQYGEKVVMRLLEASAPILSFADLGLPEDVASRLMQSIALPQGMLLVTGPTGSGKSTTLYSAQNLLRKPAVNIVTVEDPVEYALTGVNQVHVNTCAGLTFASCLRSILRQDPNVIMIGEIRDLETAEIAIKAAQTGHLVLSTLHTNDAPQTLTRMVDMGVKPYAIATSVSLIIAQRLARKLCSNCKQSIDIPPEALRKEGFEEADITNGIRVYKAVGCSQCTDGYKGRVGIYQVMPVTDTIGRIIMEGGGAIQIGDQATKDGIWNLRRAGLEKVRNGVTSLEEVNNVTVE
jgi:type IV pilus assembly protein PilB